MDVELTSQEGGAGEPLDSAAPADGLGWTPPSAEMVAALLPQYEIFTILGRGGMGAVYQGRQAALERPVAIKLLPLEISADSDFAQRFVAEARALARLVHPNIISIYDFGQTAEGHFYFVMEYVDGATLHDLIHGRCLQPAQAAGIVQQICEALSYAHGEGIIHRDIKPANVMVDQRGRVKIADFGLARLIEPGAEHSGSTMTRVIMGTPDYMAPEQKRGRDVDHRADIFSVGVVLYEALAGEVPEGAFEPLSQRVGLDKRLDAIVSKALAPQPEKRFQTTMELFAALDAVRPALVKGDARRGSGGAARRATRVRLLAGAGLVLAITAGAAWYLHRPDAAPSRSLVASPPSSIAPSALPPSAQTPLPQAPLPESAVERPASAPPPVEAETAAATPPEPAPVEPAPPVTPAPPAAAAPMTAEAPAETAPESPAGSPPAPLPPGHWRNMLSPESRPDLHNGAYIDAQGLHLSHASTLWTWPLRDAAISLTTNYDPAVDKLSVRVRVDSGAFYSAVVKSAGEVRLGYITNRTHVKELQTFPLRRPLRTGERYELELRVVGDLLTVKINGERLGDVRHSALTAGVCQVADEGKMDALVLGAQLLELDPPPGGQPVAEASAPAANPAPAPSDPAKVHPEMKKWLAQMDAQYRGPYQREVTQPYEQGLAGAKQHYLLALAQLLAAAEKSRRLDEVLAVGSERHRAQIGPAVPPDDADQPLPAIRALRTDYRAQALRLDQDRMRAAKTHLHLFDQALSEAQAALAQKQRLEDIKLLQSKRDEIAREWLQP